MGLAQVFVREYNEYENKSELFWNSLIIPLIFSVIIGEMYVVFYRSTSLLMFDSIERYTVIILSISFPYSIISTFNMLVLRMEENARIYSLFNIIDKFLILIILISYLLFIDRSYKRIINATFIKLILVCLIQSYYVKVVWKNKFRFNKMFKFGIPLIPANIVGWSLIIWVV